MIRVPEEIEARFVDKAIRLPEVSIIRYEVLQTLFYRSAFLV